MYLLYVAIFAPRSIGVQLSILFWETPVFLKSFYKLMYYHCFVLFLSLLTGRVVFLFGSLLGTCLMRGFGFLAWFSENYLEKNKVWWEAQYSLSRPYWMFDTEEEHKSS